MFLRIGFLTKPDSTRSGRIPHESGDIWGLRLEDEWWLSACRRGERWLLSAAASSHLSVTMPKLSHYLNLPLNGTLGE